MSTIIRKLFKYEMSHVVREAYTRRCSHSIHGHSYKMELCLTGEVPDIAQMVMDFSLVKKYYHTFVDSFDHAHMIWNVPSAQKEIEYIRSANERYIIAPFSSTAEMQAKMFYVFSENVLNYLKSSGLIDQSIRTDCVRVHETDTGYAEFRMSTGDKFPEIDISEIEFSDGIINEWSNEYCSFYIALLDHTDTLGSFKEPLTNCSKECACSSKKVIDQTATKKSHKKTGTYQLEVQVDVFDTPFIVLPEPLLKTLGWSSHTNVAWTVKDGVATVTKVTKK